MEFKTMKCFKLLRSSGWFGKSSVSVNLYVIFDSLVYYWRLFQDLQIMSVLCYCIKQSSRWYGVEDKVNLDSSSSGWCFHFHNILPVIFKKRNFYDSHIFCNLLTWNGHSYHGDKQEGCWEVDGVCVNINGLHVIFVSLNEKSFWIRYGFCLILIPPNKVLIFLSVLLKKNPGRTVFSALASKAGCPVCKSFFTRPDGLWVHPA